MDNQSKIEKEEVIKEKPVKKSKNIAVIFAILALALTVIGIALTGVFSTVLTALYAVAYVMITAKILYLVAFLLLLLFIGMAVVGTLFLVINYLCAFVFSVIALISNRKNKNYAATTLGCVSAPISFLYLLSALKSFVGALLTVLLLFTIIVAYIVYIVIFLGIVAIFI